MGTALFTLCAYFANLKLNEFYAIFYGTIAMLPRFFPIPPYIWSRLTYLPEPLGYRSVTLNPEIVHKSINHYQLIEYLWLSIDPCLRHE